MLLPVLSQEALILVDPKAFSPMVLIEISISVCIILSKLHFPLIGFGWFQVGKDIPIHKESQ
jgi:hypothetical protein